jgi:[protein-PII] uridylyltransferase
VSEEPKRSETELSRSSPLDQFLAASRRWSGPVCPGPEAWAIGEELSAAMDRALEGLAPESELTVVAVGGYGHRRLSLHSDVDLLLLHPGKVEAATARSFLYPLWDRRVKVGHALRTVRETLALARDDLTVLCSLLDARLIGGPPAQFDDLIEGLVRLLRNERASLPALLADEEAEVWAREPFPVQDPDLKWSRGGLRSLDRLRWERVRARLLGDPDSATSDEELGAGRTLVSVRAALHAVTGRAADRYAIELRGAVGGWLQRDPLDLAGEVYRTLRTVDSWTGLRFGGLRRAGQDPVAAAGRGVIRFVRERWSRSLRQPRPATVLSLARRAALAGNGRLSPWEFELAGETPPPDWGESDREALVGLLAAGRPGWEAISALWETGWLPRALPELGHLRAQPQVAPFHRHPADAHLGRTVDELLAVSEGEEDWCVELADQIGALDEVLLAAFLHDAGKGLPGDHSEVGADLAAGLLSRLGFGTSTTSLVSQLVRHHLLLPQVAFRRDVEDPRVIGEVGARIGDPHTLRALTLLTVADAKATGEESWSRWRSVLLRALYSRLAASLTESEAGIHSAARRRLAELVGGELSSDAIEVHLAGMSPGYLLRFGSEGVAAHLRLANPPPAPGRIRMAVMPAAPVTTVVTAALDRPGLLAQVSGVLSLHNLAVLEARVETRADGLALDSFRVVDSRGADMIGATRWPGVREDLGAAVAGRLDLEERLARKRADYRSPGSGPAEVEVFGSGPSLVIEVRTADRIGLLYQLARALAELGLDVRLAKIDTRNGRAVDVFTVRDPLSDRDHRAPQVREALVRELSGPG